MDLEVSRSIREGGTNKISGLAARSKLVVCHSYRIATTLGGAHMNFRRRKAATSWALNSNHSPFFRFASKRRCQ